MPSEIVVVSKHWKEYLATVTSNKNVSVIGNPIDIAPLLAIGESQRRSNVVLFLGRLDRQKGIIDLVDAMEMVLRGLPDTVLRFAGEGDSEGIITRSEELGIRNSIELMGWVSGEAKLQAFAEASVYVLPSYMEGSPVAVLEAMAAGLPVVASAVGGIPDVIEDKLNGYLVTPGDSASLAKAIVKVLQDPKLRREMGKTSRIKIASDYDPHQTIEHLEQLYRKLGAREFSTATKPT